MVTTDLAFNQFNSMSDLSLAVDYLTVKDCLERGLEDCKRHPRTKYTPEHVELMKKDFEKYLKVEEAKAEIERFVTENIGISTMHPVMDPQSWKVPFGQVKLILLLFHILYTYIFSF